MGFLIWQTLVYTSTKCIQIFYERSTLKHVLDIYKAFCTEMAWISLSGSSEPELGFMYSLEMFNLLAHDLYPRWRERKIFHIRIGKARNKNYSYLFDVCIAWPLGSMLGDTSGEVAPSVHAMTLQNGPSAFLEYCLTIYANIHHQSILGNEHFSKCRISVWRYTGIKRKEQVKSGWKKFEEIWMGQVVNKNQCTFSLDKNCTNNVK